LDGYLVFVFTRGTHHFEALAELDAALVGGVPDIAEKVLSTLAELTAQIITGIGRQQQSDRTSHQATHCDAN
jgi:hypothetical protein